jgi:hypothetical protein
MWLVMPANENQTITSDTDYLRLSLPSYLTLSHKLIELSIAIEPTYLEEILLVSMYCPGKIRRCSGTAVMTIKESLNIAKIHVLFRGNKECQILSLR